MRHIMPHRNNIDVGAPSCKRFVGRIGQARQNARPGSDSPHRLAGQ
jgi:hypothetical protein